MVLGTCALKRGDTHGKTNTCDDDVREPARAASPSEPEKPCFSSLGRRRGQTVELFARPACEAAHKEEECQGPLPAQTHGRMGVTKARPHASCLLPAHPRSLNW